MIIFMYEARQNKVQRSIGVYRRKNELSRQLTKMSKYVIKYGHFLADEDGHSNVLNGTHGNAPVRLKSNRCTYVINNSIASNEDTYL